MEPTNGARPNPDNRAKLVDARLKAFYHPGLLDEAEVEASKNFHIEHWIRMAESAIQTDHRQSLYGNLTPTLEQTVLDCPSNEIPPDLQRVLVKDLAFMEGHVRAFRLLMEILEEARNRCQPGPKG